MEVKAFTIVAEVLVPEGKVKEVESWNENITIEDFIESVIKDHVQDRGMLCKVAVVEGDLYKDVKEYACNGKPQGSYRVRKRNLRI